jgi:hypothetical protein
MAEDGSWPSIRAHGLRSTSALLDLFEIGDPDRALIESRHRSTSVTIKHPVYGSAVIRDQQPMDDRGLARALQDGITPREWYELLNRHVFFWVSERRLRTLLGARLYRSRRQTILIVDTARLLSKVGDRVALSPINTGATKPMPHPRGRDCFLSPDRYPFRDWERRRRGREPIVELAVGYAVPNVELVVQQVLSVGGASPARTLWSKEGQSAPDWDP